MEDNANSTIDRVRERIKLQRTLQLFKAFIKASHQAQVPTIPVMNKSIVGIESGGPFELLLCAFVIPVIIHLDYRQGIVSFSEGVIEFQCLFGCFSRPPHPLTVTREGEKGH